MAEYLIIDCSKQIIGKFTIKYLTSIDVEAPVEVPTRCDYHNYPYKYYFMDKHVTVEPPPTINGKPAHIFADSTRQRVIYSCTHKLGPLNENCMGPAPNNVTTRV